MRSELHPEPPLPPVVTHRSIAKAWECDDNRHLNARFYADRFQQASAIFGVRYGLSGALDAPRSLVYRFHHEVRQGQILAIESTLVSGAPNGAAIGHRLIGPTDGRLFASVLDGRDWLTDGHDVPVRQFVASTDAPRSQLDSDQDPSGLAAALDAGGIRSGTGLIRGVDTGDHGICSDRVHVGYFSDGAAMVWQAIGLGADRLRDEGWGRMVVDLCVRRLRPAIAGQILEQISRVCGQRSRALVMRHDQFDAVSGHLVASAQAMGMLVCLKTRRALAFPPDVRRLVVHS